jgi:mannan endo-1,4-beta-mannosidase
MTIARRFAVLAATMLTIIAAACAAAPQPASKPVKAVKPGKLLFGVYEQTSPGSYTQLNQFTQATGVYPAIVSYYSQWWMTFQTGFADEAHANGAEVLVQMQPRQVSCQAISSGVTDGYLEQYASQVKSFRYPVILSFGQEMNGNWYPWGVAGCAPGAFIAAWKHVVKVFRASGANNVTWLWDPNVNYAGGPPLRDWWPGSSYVDWVGLDGYYAYPADTFGTLFLPSINAIRSFTDKPLLIAESGVTAMDGTGRLKDLYTGASDADAVGVVYFDVKQSGDPEHQDWRLEDSSGMLQTFRSLAQVLTRRQLSPLTVADARSRSRSSRATRTRVTVPPTP